MSHEADLNLALLESVGILPVREFPKFQPEGESEREANRLLESGGFSAESRFVIVHPGSGGSARNWPRENYREIVKRLIAEGYNVVLTGSASESELCEFISDKSALNLAGKMSLLVLASIIRRSEGMIAGSTGPLHLAVALGKRVTGLYPPVADCLPERWGPYGHPDWALMPALPLCSRCTSSSDDVCECMKSIQPEVVLNHFKRTQSFGEPNAVRS